MTGSKLPALALTLCLSASLFSIPAFASAEPPAAETANGEWSGSAAAQSAVPGDAHPFTPDGAGSVVDHATETDGKEFFTVETPDGSVFYLIVDRERASDNVYFLDAVTERDLLSLAKLDGATGESAVPPPEPPAGTTTPEAPVSAPPAEKSGGTGSGATVFIVLAALAAGGTGYYFKIVRPKKQTAEDEECDEEEDENGYAERDAEPGWDDEDKEGETK
jgi:hypothetical protein